LSERIGSDIPWEKEFGHAVNDMQLFKAVASAVDKAIVVVLCMALNCSGDKGNDRAEECSRSQRLLTTSSKYDL
jgi:hypothetical protein